MNDWMPFDLDVDVHAVLSKVAVAKDGVLPIGTLLELDKEFATPVWEAARLGWLKARANSGDPFCLIAELHIDAATATLATKGAEVRGSSIGLVLLRLYDVDDAIRQASDRYTARLRMSDLAVLAENCIDAEFEQHLIANRHMPRPLTRREALFEHHRAIRNHQIWQSGIELARFWCETLARFPDIAQHREWLRRLRHDLGDFAKMDPATGSGAVLQSIEGLQAHLDGWRVLSPPEQSERPEKLKGKSREREIAKLIREYGDVTRDFLVKRVGCGAGTVSKSPAYQQMLQRRKTKSAGQPRRGGHHKQRPLGSVDPPARSEIEQVFFDRLSEETRRELDVMDTEARRGGI